MKRNLAKAVLSAAALFCMQWICMGAYADEGAVTCNAEAVYMNRTSNAEAKAKVLEDAEARAKTKACNILCKAGDLSRTCRKDCKDAADFSLRCTNSLGLIVYDSSQTVRAAAQPQPKTLPKKPVLSDDVRGPSQKPLLLSRWSDGSMNKNGSDRKKSRSGLLLYNEKSKPRPLIMYHQ